PAGVPRAAGAARAGAGAALAAPGRGLAWLRPRWPGVLVRLRGSAAPGVRARVLAGQPAGDQRRVPGVRGGRRLPHALALALRRLGPGARRGLGRAALLGALRRRVAG